jgi:hypothetical protein
LDGYGALFMNNAANLYNISSDPSVPGIGIFAIIKNYYFVFKDFFFCSATSYNIVYMNEFVFVFELFFLFLHEFYFT